MQNDMSTVVMWSKSKPDVEFQYGGRLGEFMACNPRATYHVARLQGVRIPSAILKIVFRHVLFFLML